MSLALTARYQKLQGKREALSHRIEGLEVDVARLRSHKSLLDKVAIVLKKLVDRATKEDLTKIEEFVTSGLQKVFYDQDIECKIRTTSKTGVSKLAIVGKQGPVEGPFLTTFGGGAWNVASFLLRIIVILRTKMRRRIFLDESFSKLSDKYQPAMSELVSSLAEKLGFQILLVTHQPTFAEHADRVYRAKKSRNKLILTQEK